MGDAVFPHATGDPTAWVVMDGQGGLVQHPAAGFIKVGKVPAGVAAMAV